MTQARLSTGVKSYSQSTLLSVQPHSNYLVKCSHFARSLYLRNVDSGQTT